MSESPSKFEVGNLAIVIAAKNHNPTVVNPDFLKHNHIVPENWELIAAPVCVEPVAIVRYAQGVNIVAQADRVSFTENITGRPEASVVIPKIAMKFVETLRHVNYHALGINPGGHVVVEGGADGVRDFIAKKFLSPAIVNSAQTSPVRGGVRLSFPVDGWTANVGVEEGLTQTPGEAPVPVVVFEGNYHHDLTGNTVEERLKNLQECLAGWPKHLQHFRNFVSRVLAI